MHHAQLLKDTRHHRDVPVDHIDDDVGQSVMVKHHARHTFETKYLSNFRVLHQVNKCILLLLIPDGNEQKPNTGNVKPCTIVV